jgi:integrase
MVCLFGEPSSVWWGSQRTVHLPKQALSALSQYLSAQETAPLPTAWLFTRNGGAPLERQHVQVALGRARDKMGLSEYRFHGLRHAGLPR